MVKSKQKSTVKGLLTFQSSLTNQDALQKYCNLRATYNLFKQPVKFSLVSAGSSIEVKPWMQLVSEKLV